MTTRKSVLENVISGCDVRSEYRIDVLNAKSIGNKHLNVFITERFIKKTVSFWDPVKKFRRSHQKFCIKNVLLKTPLCSQKNTCVRVPATLLKRDSNPGVFL